MSRWIVHVGPGKTGTTFLQTMVFDRAKDLHAAGRPHHDRSEFRDFRDAVTREEDSESAIGRMRKFVEAEERRAGGRTIVLSDETLALAPMWCEMARRLAAVLPQAEVLITIRNQKTAVVSYYGNHGRVLRDVPHPYVGRHVGFNDWFDHAVRAGRDRYFDSLDYDAFVKTFERVFGERVHVLKYETLVRDHDAFAVALSGILGVDVRSLVEADAKVNPRQTRRAMAYEKFRSRFLPGIRLSSSVPFADRLRPLVERFIKGGRSIKADLTDEQIRCLNDLYSAGNAAVDAAYRLSLADDGYPLG